MIHSKWEMCNGLFSANDGHVLLTFPTHIQNLYPVFPRFARGLWHLSKTPTADLELLMRTYANASFVSSSYFRKLGALYVEKVETYLAKNPTTSFVKFDDWRKGFLPPSPAVIRKLFLDAERSPWTQYGYSNMSRYCQELQSVEVKSGKMMSLIVGFSSAS